MLPKQKGSTMLNNSIRTIEIKIVQVEANDQHKMEKLMERLRRHEELENSTLQIIDEMRKKFEEKMGVLEAKNHRLKA